MMVIRNSNFVPKVTTKVASAYLLHVLPINQWKYKFDWPNVMKMENQFEYNSHLFQSILNEL